MGEPYIPDQLRGHAEDSDGIEEYDNKLPTWWVGLFVLTVIWGIGVIVDWHIITPHNLSDSYEAEMAAAPQPIDLNSIEIVMSDAAIASGAEIFATRCVACHMADATGGIGPSLVDDEWIHGSGIPEVRETIALGVLDKGMPPWLPVIGPEGLAHVTAYVLSLTAPN